MKSIIATFMLSVSLMMYKINTFDKLPSGTVNLGPLGGDNTVKVDSNGVAISSPGDQNTNGSLACKNCTDYVQRQFGAVIAALQSQEHTASAAELGPCSSCISSGLSTLEIYEDVCVTPTPNQPNFTDTKVFFIFHEMSLECNCSLSNNLPDLTNEFTQLQMAVPTCGDLINVNDATQLTEGTVQGATWGVMNTNPFDTLTCAKINSTSTGVSTNFTLTAVKKDYIFEFTVRKNRTMRGPKSVTVPEFHVVDRNFSNIKVDCQGEGGLQTCQCIIDSAVFAIFMEDAAEAAISCEFKDKTNLDLRGTLEAYLSCHDFV